MEYKVGDYIKYEDNCGFKFDGLIKGLIKNVDLGSKSYVVEHNDGTVVWVSEDQVTSCWGISLSEPHLATVEHPEELTLSLTLPKGTNAYNGLIEGNNGEMYYVDIEKKKK